MIRVLIFLFLINYNCSNLLGQEDYRMNVRCWIDNNEICSKYFPEKITIGVNLMNEFLIDSVLIEKNEISIVWSQVSSQYCNSDYVVRIVERTNFEMIYLEIDNRNKVYSLILNERGELVYLNLLTISRKNKGNIVPPIKY